MKTKPAPQFKILLQPYSFYIKENLRKNEELELAQRKENPPMLLKQRLNYWQELVKNYQLSKIKYLL